MRGWGGRREGGVSQSYAASEIHVHESMPSRKINSNTWSPGKGAEGHFPALHRGWVKSRSYSPQHGSMQQPSLAGEATGDPHPLEEGNSSIGTKNKETWGETPPTSSPTVRASRTSHTASTTRQRGQKSLKFSFP